MENQQNYCNDCRFRLDRGPTETLGNTARFCEIGYRVNPKSKEATRNAMKNGSQVCSMNPWKVKLGGKEGLKKRVDLGAS